jgi:catechol 2,3-dioxygenase-like lactoylglutathione lyase family enzyme
MPLRTIVTRRTAGPCLAGLVVITGLLHGCVDPKREVPSKGRQIGQGPLRGADVMAFAVIRDAAAARAFYEGTLGLSVMMEDSMALVLTAGDTVIRLQKIADHQPRPYTVLGWRVTDIEATLSRLRAAGVEPERFAWMSIQNDDGIATFPNGDRVVWFKDPDGNTLGIAQLQ